MGGRRQIPDCYGPNAGDCLTDKREARDGRIAERCRQAREKAIPPWTMATWEPDPNRPMAQPAIPQGRLDEVRPEWLGDSDGDGLPDIGYLDSKCYA